MSTGVGYTSYSALFGGGKGFFNPAGWNTTLTAVDSTANETIGVVRPEGANSYMYVQFGTTTASAGNILVVSTGYTDTNSVIAPFACTAGGTAATGNIALGMAVATAIASGVVYGWMLIRGIATANLMTDMSATPGKLLCPSTGTANLFEQGATGFTAVARVVAAAATGVASAGGAGTLVYYNFGFGGV